MRLAVLLLAALPACGQLISAGIKVGVPLTDAFWHNGGENIITSSYDRRYIIGPTAEVRLPFHLAFEVDALYRRNGFVINFTGLGSPPNYVLPPTTTRVTVNDWQVPFLAKYRRDKGPVEVFADGGIVYRHVSSGSSELSAPDSANTSGIAVGGGVSLKLLLIRVSPEIRYTHWFTRPFSTDVYFYNNSDQTDFLLGITF